MIDDLPIKILSGSPDTFGWLRRKELDSDFATAWETPDGQIMMFPPHIRPQLFRRASDLLPAKDD